MAQARRSPASLAAGASALVLAAGIAVALAVPTGAVAPFVAIPGVLGALLLAVSLGFATAVLLPSGLVLLLAEYAVYLVVEGGDRFAPAVAAAVLVVAELAYWGVEPRSVGRGGAVVARRVLVLVALAAGAALVAGLLLGAGGLVRAGGAGVVAVGVIGAVAVAGVLAWLARTSPARPR